MERDQQFLEYVVKALVDNPDAVKINRVVDEMGVLLTLSVHPDDMGKVIGRSGATAKAIRTVLRVVGMKNDARVNLKIEEPEGSQRPAAKKELDPDADTGGYVHTHEKHERQEKSLEDVLDGLK